MTEVRYVFRQGKIQEANSEELAAILAEEAIEPDVRNQQDIDGRKDAILYDLREERDSLLSESDWTQYTDSPLTTEKKTAWAAYRTLLRDFPATFIDEDGNLLLTILDPTWPTKPT